VKAESRDVKRRLQISNACGAGLARAARAVRPRISPVEREGFAEKPPAPLPSPHPFTSAA